MHHWNLATTSISISVSKKVFVSVLIVKWLSYLNDKSFTSKKPIVTLTPNLNTKTPRNVTKKLDQSKGNIRARSNRQYLRSGHDIAQCLPYYSQLFDQDQV